MKPAHVMALCAHDGDGAAGQHRGESHVQVLAAPAEVPLEGVPVELGNHRCWFDGQPGLLRGFPPGRSPQGGVGGIDVATELKPGVGLAVMGEQHVLAGLIKHQAGRGEMGRRPEASHPVGMLAQQLQEVTAQRFLPGIRGNPRLQRLCQLAR